MELRLSIKITLHLIKAKYFQRSLSDVFREFLHGFIGQYTPGLGVLIK